jgi:uncharacterized protein YciI
MAPDAAETRETVLLDAVDRRLRGIQHGGVLLGVILLLLSGAAVRAGPVDATRLMPIAAGLAVIVAAMAVRQRWEIQHRGHRIRFENHPWTSERLYVDDRVVARGGLGRVRVLEGRLPDGTRIIATSNAGFLSFRCRIVALAPARHFLLFYDVVSDYVERRAAYRAEHLALAQAAVARGELVLGGALGDPVEGAVLLFHGDSAQVAERFAAADPYVRHGLVTRWRVRPWSTVVGPAAVAPVASAPSSASVPAEAPAP